jgi:uncharacterized protein with PQ loop repeat
MMKMMRSKKGSTLTNWVFLIMGISLYLVLIQTQVLNPMNATYGKNLSIGLNDEAMANIDAIDSRRGASAGEIGDAEVKQTSEGLTFLQIGSIAKGIFNMVGDFANGRFLETLMVDQLDFPPIVPRAITILIWMSLIFIIVRIFMRGTTP